MEFIIFLCFLGTQISFDRMVDVDNIQCLPSLGMEQIYSRGKKNKVQYYTLDFCLVLLIQKYKNLKLIGIFYFQAYILGCSFDSFAPTWEARSYIIVLIILAWILPITVVGFCYSQIIHSVSKNLFYLSAINPQTSEIEKARKVSQQKSFLLFFRS